MHPLLKLLPTLAVLLFVAGCGKSDPYAKYRDAQLQRGMTIAEIKEQFGEPDSFEEYWSKVAERSLYSGVSRQKSPEHPYQIHEFNYGAFGAHDQKRGHITRHRLSLTFVDGELIDWYKSTPIDDE